MTAALEGGEWSAAGPSRTLPPGNTRYPFYRRLGGPQVPSGRAENLVPTGIWSRTVQPAVSRYTDWIPDPYIYIYIYIYIYTYTQKHTHARARAHTHTYVCMSLSLVLSPVLDLVCRVNFCDLENLYFFPVCEIFIKLRKFLNRGVTSTKKK